MYLKGFNNFLISPELKKYVLAEKNNYHKCTIISLILIKIKHLEINDTSLILNHELSILLRYDKNINKVITKQNLINRITQYHLFEIPNIKTYNKEYYVNEHIPNYITFFTL